MLKDQHATAAVEFALVAAPFFGLLAGIMLAGIYFFGTMQIEAGLVEAKRALYVGTSISATDALQRLCSNVISISGCQNSVTLDLQPYSADLAPVDPADPQFDLGTSGQIMIVRAVWQSSIAALVWRPSYIATQIYFHE